MRRINIDLITRIAISFLAVVSLTTCGFGPKLPPKLPSSPNLGINTLFFNIEKNAAGNYVVSRISNVDGMIRMNDLSPTFETADAACAGASKELFNTFRNAPECVKLEETFRTMKMNIGAYSTPWYRYSTFDVGAFTKAMNDAMRNSNINREAILQEYDAYVQQYQDKAVRTYEQQKKRYYDNWAKIAFDFQIKDRSGYYSNELQASLPGMVMLVGKGPLPYLRKDFTGSKEEFRAYLSTADKRLTEYEMNLAKSVEYFMVSLSKVKGAAFERKGFTTSMPDTVNIRNSDDDHVAPVEIIIESKRFNKVYPTFSAEDKNVAMNFDGNKLTIRNLSDGFINISSISVYYNQLINTIKYDQPNVIQLPPRSVMKDPIDIETLAMEEIRKAARTTITKKDATKEKITFGFATKYNIAGKEKTLFSSKEYNLDSVLSSMH